MSNNIKNKMSLTAQTGKALLFDMDGTLTPARKAITNKTYEMVKELSSSGHLVCIVSGSPIGYIKEQLKLSTLKYPESLVIMPCNGTQVYSRTNTESTYKQIYSTTMRNSLNSTSSLPDPYGTLVTNILELQLYAMRRYDFSPTGNFVSDRGSMVNWAMIGRDASHEVRDAFSFEDDHKGLRKHLRECLRVRLDDSDLHMIDLTLGGSTSIDIFPKGWDKTYALTHLAPKMESWFWGDKCMPGGNDHTLYEKLGPNRAFSISSPEETLATVQSLQADGKL